MVALSVHSLQKFVSHVEGQVKQGGTDQQVKSSGSVSHSGKGGGGSAGGSASGSPGDAHFSPAPPVSPVPPASLSPSTHSTSVSGAQ